jgi:hypothetical protein
MSDVTEKKVEALPLRCPKGMKMPSYVKAMTAQLDRSKADKNYIMRAFGIAIHEAAYKIKNTQRDAAKSRKPSIPSSGPETDAA